MNTSASYGGRSPLFETPWYVYILKCGNGTHYTGCTSDITDRVNRHAQGWVPATCERLPITLVTYTVFDDKYKAYEFEKYLKSGSGRAFAIRHFC